MSGRLGRWLVALVVAVVVVGGGFWGYSRFTAPRQAMPAGEEVEVRRGDLAVSVNASGSLSFPRKVRLSFPVAGTVLELGIAVGDEVKEGQTLSRLDEVSQRKALLQAEANLKSAELALKKAESPYDAEDLRRGQEAVVSARAALSLAQQDLTLAQTQAARNLADAQEALVQAEAATREAEAALELARADLSLSHQDLALAQARAARNLEVALRPLEDAKEAYRQQMRRYYLRELSDDEIFTDPVAIVAPGLTGGQMKLPQPLLDAYQVMMDAKAAYDLVLLEGERSLQAARNALSRAEEAEKKAEEARRRGQVRLAEVAEAVELARLQGERSVQAAGNSQERAREGLRQAEADLSEMKAGTDPEEVALKRLQVSLAQDTLAEARRDLEGTVLKAPFAGVVAEVPTAVGSRVGVGAVVVTLVDASLVEVMATVDEVDVAQVRVGQPVGVTLDVLPGRTIPGRVKSISPVGQVQAGVVSYPIVVEATTPAARRREAAPFQRRDGAPFQPGEGMPSPTPAEVSFLPREGMTALAAIVVEQRTGVLLVPSRAVRTIGGKRLVELVTPEGTVEREVTTGLSDGRNMEVVSGLAEGDKVLVRTATPIPTPPPFGPGRGFPGGGLFR